MECMINDATKKRWLYYEAIKLLDYKWKQNINFKDKNVIYEGKEFPGLRELRERGFLKNVGEPQPGWRYEIKGVDWWKLIKFAYGFFIDNSGLDQSEMYGEEKQVDMLCKIAKGKSQEKGKKLIKITQDDLSKYLNFIDIIYALVEAKRQGLIKVEDFNISLPDLYPDKTVKFEAYIRIYNRETADSLTPGKQDAEKKIEEDWLECGRLKFNKKSGDFVLGKVRGNFVPETQEFKVILAFLESEYHQVKYDALLKVMYPDKKEFEKVAGWAVDKWALDYILQKIKVKMEILPKKKAINKNIFKCLRKWKGYRLVCD